MIKGRTITRDKKKADELHQHDCAARHSATIARRRTGRYTNNVAPILVRAMRAHRLRNNRRSKPDQNVYVLVKVERRNQRASTC